MKQEALQLAEGLCSTMMRKYAPEDLPPKHKWHYHQGIFLLGMYKIYELIGNREYMEYIKTYTESVMEENGNIWYECCFDDAMPSILLFPLLEETGNSKFKMVLDQCAAWIPEYFKTPLGSFWHKFKIPHQVWLDGYYMAQPLCVKYAATFGGHDEFYKMAYDQLKLMKRGAYDAETGLWHHAFDESRKADWADKVTGSSPEFWGRAFGWIGAALVDILDYMPEDCVYRDYFVENLKEYVETVIRWQDEKTGLWYQVLNKGNQEGNWVETSCSCLFIYTVCKGIRMGWIQPEYLEQMKKAFCGLQAYITKEGEDILVSNICIGTGVGDYQHYINRPTTVNDLHGAGAFLHAMAEISKVL